MYKQDITLRAQGLVRVYSDDIELEIKFESDHIYLNLTRLNFKNVSSFFKLTDVRKIIADVSSKLLLWKFNLIVSWKDSELLLLGKNAKPNKLQKIFLSENVEVKNFKNFVKLFGGKSK